MFSARNKLFPSLLKTLNNLESRSLAGTPVICSKNSFKIQDPKDFDERVKNSKKPVIVDFFATWCNPCRTLTPRLESIVEENNGKVILAKVDIDENTDLAMDYDVMSVPVLLLIDNGKVVDKMVGLQDADKLRKFVGQVLNSQEKKAE